jgi:hypothetical protein
VPATQTSVYLATLCYGGQAHADFMASLLAFRPACARRGLELHVDLAGGEALVGRGRATLMAKFLASRASHLLFAESDRGFPIEDAFRLIEAGEDVGTAGDEHGLMLITRRAAERLSAAHPELKAKLGDMRGLEVSEAVFLFDPIVDPTSGRYLTDRQAFLARWEALRTVPGA